MISRSERGLAAFMQEGTLPVDAAARRRAGAERRHRRVGHTVIVWRDGRVDDDLSPLPDSVPYLDGQTA